VQGKIDNNPEEGNNECRSTPGVSDTLKVQDTEQMCDCDKKISKKTQKTACNQEQRFFTDRRQQELARGERNSRNKIVTMKPNLSVLHQNIESIGNKQTEVDLVLKSNLKNTDVLCFTEHWLKEDYLKLIHIDQYKLVSYFSRTNHNYGGSCTCVLKKKPFVLKI